MKRLMLAAAVAATFVVSSPALAASVYAPGQAICSGDFSTDMSAGVALFCQGDLSLSGGEIVSDTTLSITALGTLSLQDIRLVGEDISLLAWFSTINMGDKVILASLGSEAPSLAMSNGWSIFNPTLTPAETVYPGYGSVTSTLNFGPSPAGSVPEPATWALMLVGIAAAGLIRRR